MSVNQSLDEKYRERDSLFSTCALAQGKMFSFTSFKRIPIVWDFNTRKITILNDLENYDPAFNADDMLSFENNIFVLELNGKRLMKLDVKEKKCSYFHIDCNSKYWGNYAALAYYEKSIYIFPIYAEGLVKIDLKTGKVQKIKELYSHASECKKDEKQEDEFYFFWCGCQYGNKVWLFQRNGNWVVSYDMESDTWEEYELSVCMKECAHVAAYAEYIYILNAGGEIYRWDMKSNILEKIVDCGSINKTDFSFSRIVVTDKRIFLLPSISEEILYIDFNSQNIEKYDSYPEGFRYCGPEEWSKYYGYCEDNDHYYFAMRSANYILIINKRDGTEKWVKANLPFYEEYKRVYFDYNKKLLFETECSIEDIILYMKKESAGRQCRMDIPQGEGIWDYVKIFNEREQEI